MKTTGASVRMDQRGLTPLTAEFAAAAQCTGSAIGAEDPREKNFSVDPRTWPLE